MAASLAALEEWTRERLPLQWAAATLTKCNIEARIAERMKDSERPARLERKVSEAHEVLLSGHARRVEVGDHVLGDVGRIKIALGG